MSRYLVFKAGDYYPGGGWRDFEKSFDEPERAIEFAKSLAGIDSRTAVVDAEQEKELFECFIRVRGMERTLVESFL